MQNITIHFVSSFFVLKICWYSSHNNCWHIYWQFICSVYNFVRCNHWMVNNSWLNINLFTTTCNRIPNIIFFACFLFIRIFARTPIFIIIPLLIRVIFSTVKLHLHSHDIFFVNNFDPFIPTIILKSLQIKSFVLFGTNTSLDR